MSFHEALFQAELPNLLIGSGIVFLVIAVLGEVTGKFKADRTGRVAAALVGPSLIVLGLFVLFLTPGTAPVADVQATTPAQTALVSGENSLTPPARVTPMDQQQAATTPAQATPLSANSAAELFEQEPNDDAFSADVLAPGSLVSGEVRSTYSADPSLDCDYFAVWVDAGDPLTVDVSRSGGTGTLYVVLLDPNGLSQPSGQWLSDIIAVEPGGEARLNAVARQSGYHYVLVSGWIYLVDLDRYFNDGGTGAYSLEVGGSTQNDVAVAPASTLRPALSAR